MKNGNRIEVALILLVTVILVALRLDEVIQWPWLAVLSPLIGANGRKSTVTHHIGVVTCRKKTAFMIYGVAGSAFTACAMMGGPKVTRPKW